MLKLKLQYFGHPDEKSELIGKDPNAGKDWRQEEKGMTEDEMVGWHHRLNGHELEQTRGDGEGRRNLAPCSPWGFEELDTTQQLNNNSNIPLIRKKYNFKLFSCKRSKLLSIIYECFTVYYRRLIIAYLHLFIYVGHLQSLLSSHCASSPS